MVKPINSNQNPSNDELKQLRKRDKGPGYYQLPNQTVIRCLNKEMSWMTVRAGGQYDRELTDEDKAQAIEAKIQREATEAAREGRKYETNDKAS